jgi:hypothetical protein
MPRALTRDEQAILNHVRRSGAAIPVPELAASLGIAPDTAQTACEYLVGRSLLRASIYAVASATPAKQATAPTPPERIAPA